MPMLELQDVSLQLDGASEDQMLLAGVSARFPTQGHFVAILGPSGCGKSTLLKVIAGLREHTDGNIVWEGRNLAEEGDLDPHEIGYVPQFSIAYDLLTVRESVEGALRLRVAGLSAEDEDARILQILQEVGLEEIADREVRVLSGGQKRRLALAMEMVSSPRLLLCDEVTSGLDPKAEDEIAHLLHSLSMRDNRVVISVTHSLRHLSLCHSVVVLYEGHVAYHGSPEFLFHYFGVERHEDLFPRLGQRKSEDWHRSWCKHRDVYYAQSGLDRAASGDRSPVEPVERESLPVSDDPRDRLQQLFEKLHQEESRTQEQTTEAHAAEKSERPDAAPVRMPSAAAQLGILLSRRWKLFVRDRGQLVLHLALLFGFPCLVVIFALGGLPQLKGLAAPATGNFLQQMQTEFDHLTEVSRTGSLVSGLIMFQVILLALMGSNNAAREIAGERLIFEKEKFAGLSPGAYVLSKALFLGGLVIVQSVWMTLFVNWVVRFPGSLASQMVFLTFVNAALTAVCLGISAMLQSPEQASLVSVYLVGFQLPLSGAVLALPGALSAMTRPFIASYWGWAGFIQTLRNTRFYDAVLKVTQTKLATEPLCLWMLCAHVVVGLYLAYAGCRRARWE